MESRAPERGLCTADGWCWFNPLPQGNDLFGVAGQGRHFIAVGESGTVVEYVDLEPTNAWQLPDPLLFSVAEADGTWFAAGRTGGFRREAGEWERIRMPVDVGFRGVWAFSPSDALFVGEAGSIVRWMDGEARVEATGGGLLSAVRGWDDGTAMAVGEDGTILVDRSTGWQRASGPTEADLYGLWGPSADTVFVVGHGVVLRYDGVDWSETRVPFRLRGVWGRSATDVFAVDYGGRVLHFEGRNWAPEAGPRDDTLLGIAGDSSEVLAVGFHGQILRRDANGWRSLRSGVTGFGTGVRGLALGHDDVVYAAADRYALVLGGTGFVETRRPVDPWDSHEAITVSADGAPVAAGARYSNGLLMPAIWQLGAAGWRATDLGHTGSPFNPRTGMRVGPQPSLYAVWASSEGELVAVGGGGRILRFDGRRWLPERSPVRTDLHGVHGSSGTVLAVGGSGTVLRLEEEGWRREPVTTGADLRAV